MNLDFLPNNILSAIQKLDIDKLYEIRLRKDCTIKVCYDGVYRFLSDDGISILASDGIKCSSFDVETVINNLTEQSIYAYNEKIKNGFITTADGIRVGISGDCVYDNGKIVTIKNFSSLNVRIPHMIKNCSSNIFNQILKKNGVESLLIISPPFYGKTTILKDLATKINETFDFPLLIIDERGEFSSVVGDNIDSIKFSDKLFAFNNALRALAPKLIITDELVSGQDWQCVKMAVDCGIKIIASCHAKDVNQLTGKNFFIKYVFDKYVFLNDYAFIDNSFKIYDREIREI